MNLILPEGRFALPSVRGYYNFFYPDNANPKILSKSIKAKPLQWLGYDGMKAVEISQEDAIELGLEFRHIWIYEDDL